MCTCYRWCSTRDFHFTNRVFRNNKNPGEDFCTYRDNLGQNGIDLAGNAHAGQRQDSGPSRWAEGQEDQDHGRHHHSQRPSPGHAGDGGVGAVTESRSRVLNWTMSMTLWPVTLLAFLLKRRLEEAKPTPVIGSQAVAARQRINTDCG